MSHYPLKEKGCWGSFSRLSRSLKGLVTPTTTPVPTLPSPIKGLLGIINTTRDWQWLPRFTRVGEYSISTSGRHYAVAARGQNTERWRQGSECVCFHQAVCVFYSEWLNCAVVWNRGEWEWQWIENVRWREIVKYSVVFLCVYGCSCTLPVRPFVRATRLKTRSLTGLQDVEHWTLGSRAAPSEPGLKQDGFVCGITILPLPSFL